MKLYSRDVDSFLAGFGLGALNDADEDDVDIYDGALRSQSSRRIAYDATDDDDNIMMGSSRHSKRGPVNVSYLHHFHLG